MKERRVCNKCGVEKCLEDFPYREKAKNTRQLYCKECDNKRRQQNHADNRVERNKRSKEYYEQNKDHLIPKCKEWAENNRPKTRKYKNKWKANNKEAVLAHKRARRAREMGCEGSHTAAEIGELYKQQEGLCVYCKADLELGKHADHIFPLSLGGTNYISNIQLLCPLCNARKWNKPAEVFEAEIGFVRPKESVNGEYGDEGV